MPYFLLFFLALLTVVVPRHARADAQVSVRNQLEVGVRKFDGEREIIVATGVRGDAMFGWPRPKSFRIGPAFELRTANFATLEGSLGAGLLIPLPGDMPIGLTGLIGPVWRASAREPEGWVGTGTVTWGYRGYNYRSWYGYGLNLFFSGRKQLGEDLVEFTGGIEVDFVFTTIIPITAIVNYVSHGDPYEQ